jgi:TonB family protein
VYPASAGQAGIEGDVVLEVEVDRQGAVAIVRTLAGHPLLIPAATEAVRQWRYDPAMLKGEQRVATTIRVSIRRERAKVICGPFDSAPLYKTQAASEQLGVVECNEEVIVLSRTMGSVEVQSQSGRGWVSALNVSNTQPAAPSDSKPAAIGEAHLDCAQRLTLNIYDSPGAAVIARLPCGETVSVLMEDDPYAKIRTAARVEGWVLTESLTMHGK